MKYVAAVRIAGKVKAFSFPSKKQLQAFIKALPPEVEYITAKPVK